STLLSVLLSRSRPHRDLHSFPTRRSSDLTIASSSGWMPLFFSDEPHRTGWARPSSVARRSAPLISCTEISSSARYFSMRISSVRSEEHTSELQSRENLVCRLLLEKKKKKT